jgi:rare lipoprotein A
MILIYFLSFCCCLGGASGAYTQKGLATYYGQEFQGKKTASGEIFDMWAFTCAHKKLAFNTRVKVTNLKNKKTVIVRVNDRGPWVKGRIIDLSYAAAKQIDMISDGIVKVSIEVVR